MMLVCGFLGCLGQAFDRSTSPASIRTSEQQSQNRQDDRGGRVDSHTEMATGTPPPGVTSTDVIASEGNMGRRMTPAGFINAASATSAASATQARSQHEVDVQGTGRRGGAPGVSAAAATQPATVLKLDRAGPSCRTSLHVAAERGHLHVLSAIIENLCCSATAALIPEDSASASLGSAGADAIQGRDNHGLADGGSFSSGRLGAEASLQLPIATSRDDRQSSNQQHHHQATSMMHRTFAQHQQQGSIAIMEFPSSRHGAGSAPLAPEQYIQFHLNTQDADGTTALSLACRFGHVDCCRLLLGNGSARTLSDMQGNTPLHYAALRGHLGVLFMLLDEFVEAGQEEELDGYVDARNRAGCTPLHYAVWGRQSGSVQVLLQHGADVLPRNTWPAQELTPPVMVVGSTPLHLAAARGHVEICRIILKTFAERVLEPLQLGEDDPQPLTLASLDPRVQVNGNDHMPYQVAQRMGFYPLAMLLRPSIPIFRLFSDEERAVRFYGPPPLRAITAEALNKKLMSEIDALVAAAAAAVGTKASITVEALRQQRTTAAGNNETATAAFDSPWPLSTPATLEQSAAAAAVALDVEEARSSAAGAQHLQLPQSTGSSLGGEPAGEPVSISLPVGSIGATENISVGSMSVTTRPSMGVAMRVPGSLRQLNVEIAVVGAALNDGDEDGFPSPTEVHSLVLEPLPSPGLATGPGGTHPAAPRTPPVGPPSAVGGHPLSPSSVSPRLISPIAMTPSSPSGAFGGLSLPSPPQLQLRHPARENSARRSTPALVGNRSNNSMMDVSPAAALVAALSRPPSASRANGQSTGSSSRPQVLLSLPGQPDAPELLSLRMMPARDYPGREQPSVTMAASAEAVAAGRESGAAGDGQGLEVIANGTSDSSTAAAVTYGPRTPLRQPSGGSLHVRRLSASPTGVTAIAADTSVSMNSPNAATSTSGSRGGGRSNAGTLTPRSPPPPQLASNAVDSIVILDSSISGSSQRPPGLLRLRSNPLFEDCREAAGGEVASPLASSTAVASVVSAASGMPPLAEGTSEGEESAPTTGCSYVASVMPFVAPSCSGNSSSSVTAVGSRSTMTAAAAVAAAAAALSAIDDEDMECGVCMEPLPMVAVAPCRHQICGPCARRICCLNIQKPSYCPFCRATITAFVAPAPLTCQVV